MKRIPLLAAAIVPLAVSAGDKDLANWNYDSLKDSQRVSDIMDADVMAGDGSDLADVRDVAFGTDGSVKLLVEAAAGSDMIEEARQPREKEETGFEGRVSQTDNPSTRDDTNYQATDDFSRTSAISAEGDGETMALVDIEDVSFDREGAVTLDANTIEFEHSATDVSTSRAMDEVAIAEERGDNTLEDQTRPIANRDAGVAAGGDESGEDSGDNPLAGYVMASDLIGMDINLAEDESFGSVEDVLVSDGEAKAFVVDAWEGVDKQRYAIPADISAINNETGEIDLGYTIDEVTGLEEFDLDALDDGM